MHPQARHRGVSVPRGDIRLLTASCEWSSTILVRERPYVISSKKAYQSDDSDSWGFEYDLALPRI